MKDPTPLLSTLTQAAAVFVAIVGGFLVSRLVAGARIGSDGGTAAAERAGRPHSGRNGHASRRPNRGGGGVRRRGSRNTSRVVSAMRSRRRINERD